MKVIDTRRSVRTYLKKEVSNKDIDKILHSAMQAPSARNQQPWEFLVIKNQEKKELVSEKLKNISMAKNCDFLIVFMANKTNLLTEAMYPQDLASSITCAMLEARSRNIGSVWCGIYPNRERMKFVREIFALDNPLIEPFAVVCFGYPDKDDAFKYVNRYNKERVHYEVL